MSSTLAPEVISPDNPITADSVTSTLATVGLLPAGKDTPGFTSLLTGIWEMWNKIDQMEDYVVQVDEERFPRKHIRRAEGMENEWNAWAWRCTVSAQRVTGSPSGSKSTGGLLEGKRVCLKVSPREAWEKAQER